MENEKENLIEQNLEPTQEESEEVKECGQPMNPNSIYTREHDYVISRINGAAYNVSFGPQPGGLVPANPFASQQQQKFLYAHPEKVGGKKKLEEWSAATDFKHLPKKAKKKK